VEPQNRIRIGFYSLSPLSGMSKEFGVPRVGPTSSLTALIDQRHHGSVRSGYQSALAVEDVTFEKTERSPMLYRACPSP